MIIGIDGNEANTKEKVGIGEYAFELLQELSKLTSSKRQVVVYLKEPPLPSLPNIHPSWTYRVIGPRKLWTQFGLPLDLYTHFPRPDIFFTPTHYAPRFSPVSRVISIMDLSFLHFPMLFKQSDLYQLVNWTQYSVRKAHHILTISQASKNDIIKQYNIPEDKVTVTYLGFRQKNTHELPMTSLHSQYRVNKNYILFVGTLQPRKNISRLIEAFSILQKDKQFAKKKVQLIIVGKKGWLYEEILQAPREFGVESSVLFLNFIPDEELVTLYKNALCFVLPSLYEGFGLPVLEAMAHECPVITSNVSSLPEVGGDAALYIDPMNAHDIAEKIQLLMKDSVLRQELINRGKKQVQKFNWEKTAQQTLEILEQVAKIK